ncbi:alpha/beta hydrolase-fold protein [Paenibacillus sp. CC-CFT742]|nr:alpha/beta hydrolase-fold protein [Paenibacillus sp. CC-CFT742]WJH31218.1 alpha/beta hydrolase-fold protein [Paenibacillus sp. CC-CFT742]
MSTHSVIECLEGIHASQLGNVRNIYVYLPPGYQEQTDRHYPVLYVHAGQRAFGPSGPGNETWHMDRAVDELIVSGRIEPLIMVGIAHVRPVTHNEFYHYIAPEREAISVGCSGVAYEHFIIHELKPLIDHRYRTLPDKSNTGLLGSSAAALCTLHMGMRNPEVFGKLVMMSPFLVDVQLDEMSDSGLLEEAMYRLPDEVPDVQMWMDIGDAEGLFLPSQVRRVAHELLERGIGTWDSLAFLEQPEACHQESDWGARVDLPLLYMFGEVGQPVALEMQGREMIGLSGGMNTCINARLHYDSGWVESLLEGSYTSSHPHVLQVQPNGELVPVGPGSALITLTVGELSATRQYTVIPELSARVEVCIYAEVEHEEEPAESIYGGMGMKLVRTGMGRYEGRYLVPRDSGFSFRFTRGFRRFETDKSGMPVANRVIRATDNMSVHYRIQSWGSSTAKAGTGGK